MSSLSTQRKIMSNFGKRLTFFKRLFLAVLIFTTISITLTPLSALAVPCRDIPSVLQSADADQNTKLGGHVTQHISGMSPPKDASQKGKTLFEAKGKYQGAWKQYLNNITGDKAVNCSGKQAQQDVPLEKLKITNLGAYSCREADKNGVCTKWDSYITKGVFFGFIFKDGKWILNTAFPDPLT
jgi:hypothetical protein